ncbi:MBL fold metallo-hydrolase [Paenibacillus pabuli]|uniref:MBL fold metallo-hydrolase n=1 Tax=Paenibacillus pabuli TaxID=1472 RepID=UPI003CE93EA9
MNKPSMDITVLNLHMVLPTGKNPIYPVMLRDEDGITLVDTGMIGQFAELQSVLENEGVQLSDIKRIILTHSDIDHMGNLGVLVNALPEVEIWAHRDEIPYITGEQPMIKFSPERKALLPAPIVEMAEQLISQRTELKISKVLEDGDMLPLQGGIQVIHTPGHTPGHICLYFREAEFLLAADELRVVDEELVGPAPPATPDMPEAMRSLKRLLGLKLEKVLCYHGGEYTNDPSQRIAELAESAD